MLTREGFKRKTYDGYLTDMQQRAKEMWGADVNLSETSPLGKFIMLEAFSRAEESELIEAYYYNDSIEHSEGIALDRNVKRIGIPSRFSAQKATGTVKITVSPNITVEAGFLVGKENGVQYETVTSVTDDGSGVIYVGVSCTEYGVIGNTDINTITEIVTLQTGVFSVTNEGALVNGRNEETDQELTNRYFESLALSGGSTIDSIRANLLNNPNIRAAIVIENDSDSVDSDGRPPHSFESIVLGGTPTEIGQAILEKKPGGIQPYGSQTVLVEDLSGRDKTIRFSYATEKEIYVNVSLKTAATFPSDGQELVKKQVITTIGGTDTEGNIYSGLGMSDDVILMKLATNIISKIPGIDDITIEMSTDNVIFVEENIVVNDTEVATTDSNKVVISLV
jgi:uncharacterized phage protein gp47/JayE